MRRACWRTLGESRERRAEVSLVAEQLAHEVADVEPINLCVINPRILDGAIDRLLEQRLEIRVFLHAEVRVLLPDEVGVTLPDEWSERATSDKNTTTIGHGSLALCPGS